MVAEKKPPRGIVVSLCDLTGKFVEPWVEAGYDAVLVDPQHPTGVTTEERERAALRSPASAARSSRRCRIFRRSSDQAAWCMLRDGRLARTSRCPELGGGRPKGKRIHTSKRRLRSSPSSAERSAWPAGARGTSRIQQARSAVFLARRGTSFSRGTSPGTVRTTTTRRKRGCGRAAATSCRQ